MRRRLATFGPAALVLLLGSLVLYGIVAERRRVAWVMHTREVQMSLERTLSDMRDAETGQRAFLLTGDSLFLQPYTHAVASAHRHAAEVRRLTKDNATQQQRVDVVDSLVKRRAERLAENVALAGQGQRDQAITRMRAGVGRQLMDSLRSSIAVMEATEDTLLLRRQAATMGNERITVMTVIIGSIIAAVLSLLLNMMFRTIAREQQGNAEQLALQNERLAEQAAELESQAQHLQEQATELEMQRDELQRATAQLETRTEAAEAANRAKTDFLRAMSHELRTPLNAIGGYAQLMELGIRGPVTQEQQEDLARITRSQRHLLSLINDILNYAKLEAGHVNFELLDISMHEMILAMDELVRPQMEAKQITYKCDAGPEDLLVRVDPEKTLQIMLNLLSNSVKFTPPNGTIEVSVENIDGMACVHVRDNGVGIPADRHESVFEPFVQVGRSLSGPAEGTGLGLAISRDLARSMGGDLTLESEPGKGSRFTLCVPTTAKAAA
jgi:signal transduction histidine kinase